MHDVIVIGAGPIGSYTAYGLSRRGYDVLVVEKEPLPKPAPVCTGVIGLEAFTEFGLPFQAILSTVKDIRLLSPSGKTIDYRPPLPQAYTVDRGVFDQLLQNQAEREGAAFLGGTTCKDIHVSRDIVEVHINQGREPIKGRVVVLASGYNPSLSAKLGLGRISDHFEGVQTDAEVTDLTDTEIYVGRSLAPYSFAWLLPLPDGRARIGLATRRNGLVFLAQLLDHPPIRERLRSAGPFSRKLIPYGQLKKSFTERAIIVGEAAGQVKSTTHGGVYYGLIGARCAIETISEAFGTGDFGALALSRYEQRWRRILERELARGFLLRRFFSRMTDRQIDRLFDLTAKDGIMKAVREKAHFDWHHAIISSLIENPLLKTYFGNQTPIA